MRLIKIDQSHSVMQVLATNVDWSKVDPIAVQELIRDKKGSGINFLNFLNSKGGLTLTDGRFIVGDVFKYKCNSGSRIISTTSRDFKELIIDSNKDRALDATPHFSERKIEIYHLEKNLTQNELLHNVRMSPMTAERCLITLFRLINEPTATKGTLKFELDVNQRYLFYVAVSRRNSPKKMCTFILDFIKGQWCITDAFLIGEDDYWLKGLTLLYFQQRLEGSQFWSDYPY